MKTGEKQSEAGGREAVAGVAPGLERAEAELKRCFGHDGFRGGQRELVEALLSGREDRKSTRLNSSHNNQSRMPSSA